MGWTTAFALIILLSIIYLSLDERLERLEPLADRPWKLEPPAQVTAKPSWDERMFSDWLSWYESSGTKNWVRNFHNKVTWLNSQELELRSCVSRWYGRKFTDASIDAAFQQFYVAVKSFSDYLAQVGVHSQSTGYRVVSTYYVRKPDTGYAKLFLLAKEVVDTAAALEHAAHVAGIDP